MAFKLNPNPTFKAPVFLTVPGKDAPHEIEIEFRHKTPESLKDWMEEVRGKGFKEILPQIVVGWDGVYGDDDKPVPFTDKALTELISNYQPAGGEIFTAYITQLTESRAKN